MRRASGSPPGTEQDKHRAWLQARQDWVPGEMQAHERLVLVGDFNAAPEDRDSYDPVGLADTIHHTQEELSLIHISEPTRPY